MRSYYRRLRNKVLNFFRKAPIRNIYHPDFEPLIEAAFVCNGTTYYRFKKDYDMPVGRYKWVHNTLHEVDMRMTNEMLHAYIDALTKNLSGKKGHVDLTEAIIDLTKMKSHASLAFNVDTVERLATVVYFDDTEILNTYDREKSRKKIAIWRTHKNLDFFMTRPINELLKLKDFSINSLEEFVNWQRETFQILISEPASQSPGSSSNDKKSN